MVGTSTGPTSRTRPSPAPPVRLLGSGPRRWRWLVLGLALATTGALAGVTAVERLDQRQGVLVAEGDLPAGHVVGAGDLRVVRLTVADGVSVIGEQELEQVIGRPLTVPVADGSVLAATALGPDAAYPAAEEAVVGAALPPGRYPSSLQAGSAVSVVLIAEDGAAEDGGAEAYPARVESVEPSATDGSVIVELAVAALDAARISSAAATESVAVVQVPPRGGA
ncbi:adhesin HecA-like repeat protein [Nocardiopsis sp. Huas11]|uniref:SAF domain-containing protein n=1 Tax=Nocardiopsis sp. Huas11 TaxID=2183912 RepID=UPI000EB3A820|nr:SAF domain-containing protein [Nocardiopsis sp. Huas11]RKS08310.1 adhesin HecA-like repeat protein [Nocardiopsis sp. Huas11]